ncbi:Late Golgi vesicles protein [Komagataella phaffii CBS 7435]|uniref:Golgi apparatus membrane protein TVP18 n=2 Tax=Komagataella phaffii TaxID=460519 RepID=C4R026_KOMPG|nr:Integral membrane protein localized to late Golgi vesicles along with the v-SNARE Tlg2p [Komagataella phaffii GS115]AOA61887.1 GQ67_00268T0 [Komagataella phaffii]KAI0462748.1 Golgi apparatus membrane protein tvp18 [Komagataella kurtzmanii]CAH2448649.1 Late Golgi vesicles protein [Komagataella phaffii CBS 7435]AOA68019.1 GQ68_01121T0 [Komagataella phaffii GS115]CAY68850.1 Integral membrane protein localized to late Golgi vesicles along with the v-SNARE Tlg2p [Komagataella phaffii GS115]
MAFTDYLNFKGLGEDFKSRNFSIYGQWIAIINIFFCLALGIANIFHFSLVILFSIISIVQGLVVVFVEVPFLLKICPMSANFIEFINRFKQNWPRAGFYAGMALVQWLSIIVQATSLIVVASLFTLSAACYGYAALAHQEFRNSNVVGDFDVEALPAEAVVRNIL